MQLRTSGRWQAERFFSSSARLFAVTDDPPPRAAVGDRRGEAAPPRAVVVAFWRIVLLLNVGVFAVALGVMLVVFRGEFTRGGAIAVIGVLTLAYAVVRYRRRPTGERELSNPPPS